MMQPSKTATLKTIFSDVLANMAFMFNDDDDLDLSEPEVTWLETAIGYRGPWSGELTLWCTRGFAVLLSANLLGVDPRDDDAQSKSEDAVKEFMNIICGQLVTAIHGSEQVFDLTIPVIQELAGPPAFTEVDDPNLATLCIEGNPVQLCYTPGDAAGGD